MQLAPAYPVISICLLLAVAPEAKAQDLDIAIYGGTTVNNTHFQGGSDRSNSIAISVGTGIPGLSSNYVEIRADLSYLFADFSFPSLRPDPSSFGQVIEFQQNVERNTFYFHTGPVLNTGDRLGRFNLSAGAQIGLQRWKVTYDPALESYELLQGPPGPVVYARTLIGDEFTGTDFSYQFPVGLDFAVTERLSVGARYRAIGSVHDGDNDFEHVVEGGIRIEF